MGQTTGFNKKMIVNISPEKILIKFRIVIPNTIISMLRVIFK